jgi:aminoglycoside phosphotransferase (APT) family kinase protein
MSHIPKSKINISDKKIGKVLEKYDKSLKVKNIISIKEGVANPVFIIKTQKQEIVLRILNPITGDWKALKEERVYELFTKNKIPCPTILKTDITKELIPFDYVLSKKLKGHALDKGYANKPVNLKMARELGKNLGKIHSITFNKFGDISKKGNKFIVGPAHELSEVSKKINPGPFKSWKKMHGEIIKSRLFYFKGTEFEDLINPIKKYFKQNESLLDYKITPRLLHLDFHRNNIFVKNDKITGILDVEESLVGHNEYDLMRSEIHFKGHSRLRKEFFKAYEPFVKLDPGYQERRAFYSLSRSLVGVRCLVLWGSRHSKKEYLKEKNWIRSHITKILKTNKLDL